MHCTLLILFAILVFSSEAWHSSQLMRWAVGFVDALLAPKTIPRKEQGPRVQEIVLPLGRPFFFFPPYVFTGQQPWWDQMVERMEEVDQFHIQMGVSYNGECSAKMTRWHQFTVCLTEIPRSTTMRWNGCFNEELLRWKTHPTVQKEKDTCFMGKCSLGVSMKGDSRKWCLYQTSQIFKLGISSIPPFRAPNAAGEPKSV